MIASALQWLVALGVRRPFAVLGASIALVAGAVLFATGHFAMTTDTAALISPEIRWRQNEKAVETAFPQLRDVLLVIVDGETPELAEAATVKLSAALADDTTHFRTVQRPDGGAFFDREGLLFGSTDAVKGSTKALIEAQPLLGPLASDPSLRGVVERLLAQCWPAFRMRSDIPLVANRPADAPHGRCAGGIERRASRPFSRGRNCSCEPGAGLTPRRAAA